MKIDLHVHTKKTIQDSGNSVEINSPEDFIKQIYEANVGIVAITNHNLFDKEQFEEIKKFNSNNIIILPGVELDVEIPDKNNTSSNLNKPERRQLNLIIEDRKDCIDKLLKFIEENKISNENPVEINKVIKEFGQNNKEKNIFNLDYKKNDNVKFTKNEIDEYFIKNNLFKSAMILDVNKFKDFNFFIRNWNIKCLIGSDNKTWKKGEYKNLSKKLIEYHSFITNYDFFYDILKNGETSELLSQFNLEETFNNLVIKDKNKEVCKIDEIKIIKEGINVIFGPKASGKSALLEELKNNLHVDENKKKFYTYSETEWILFLKKQENFENFENNKIKEILEILKEIKNFSLDNVQRNTINSLYNLYLNKLKHNLHFINAKLLDIDPDINNESNKTLNSIFNYINYILDVFEKNSILEKEEYKTEYFKKVLEEFKENSIKKCFFDNNKKYWIHNFQSKTQKKIKEIYQKHKNIDSEVNDFAMLSIYRKRKNFLEQIDRLKNIWENIEKEKEINTFCVPIENHNTNKRKWKIIKKIDFELFAKIKNNDSVVVSTLKKLLKEYKIHQNPLYYTQSLKDENFEKKDFFSIKSQCLLREEPYKTPSNGEKAYICLMNALTDNDNYDFFFLDEPEMHLNNKFISEEILKELKKMISNKRKTIIFTTHNSVLGLNTRPVNYILRETESINEKEYYQVFMGTLCDKKMKSCYKQTYNQEVDIRKKILEYFEGNEVLYNERVSIYGLNERNEEN